MLGNITCWECGVAYAVPDNYLQGKIDDGKPICCPNGHENHYAPNDEKDDKDYEGKLRLAEYEISRLKRKVDELKQKNFKFMHEIDQLQTALIEAKGGHFEEHPMIEESVAAKRRKRQQSPQAKPAAGDEPTK